MSQPDLAPYARIAAELRAQIESGTLAPGDRLPSTREIKERWGVAMATATKALTTLRHKGLVRVIPGVGTVVAAGAGASTSARGRDDTTSRVAATPQPVGLDGLLSRRRIVEAAIAVADAEGLTAISMRRIATDLGVATMSLYRHVSDKDDLLLQMIGATADEWRPPSPAPDGWRERVELATVALWATFRRHPWLALALSVTRPQPTPTTLAYAEWVLDALDGVGLDLATMLSTHISLVNYVRGCALSLEQESDAQAATGLDGEQWLATQEAILQSIVMSGGYPVFERLVATGYDFDLERLFGFGLQRMLDGIAVLIRETRAAS